MTLEHSSSRSTPVSECSANRGSRFGPSTSTRIPDYELAGDPDISEM